MLYGRYLLWPFVSDDFVFLDASRRLGEMFSSFDVYANYFRPIGRELYFFAGYLLARNHPLPYHLFNFLVLLGVVTMVVWLGARLASPRAGLLAGTSYALLYSHALVLAWVSCAQDLLAACFALLAVHALLSRRRAWAVVAHVLALLSKESVATLPLVYAVWLAWSAPRGTPWRRRLGAAWRESAPLWAATAAWACIVLAARMVRHAWFKGPGGALADVSLTAASMWEGFRSALLSYVALEQPWDAIGRALVDPHQPWLVLVAACVVVLVIVWASRRFTASLPNRSAPGAARMLGVTWAVLGALPIALAGHHYSAYYITFSAIGFALAMGWLLARAAPALAFAGLAASATLGLAANRVDLFNFTRMEPVAGVSLITITRLEHELVFLDSLHVAMDRVRPPRGSVVYLTHSPHQTTYVTMSGRAARVWFDDPGLGLRLIGEYHPPEASPHAFLRFDASTSGFVQVPNDVMDADLAAEAAMGAKRPDLARPHLERALGLLPGDGLRMVRLDLLNNLGFASVLLGDTARARDSWRAVLELDPSFRSAALNLARLDQQAGRLADSRAALERLLERTPEDADALTILAEVQQMQGDRTAAEATIARLAAVDPARAAAFK